MTNFKLLFGMYMAVLILSATCSFAQTSTDVQAKAKERIDAMDTNKDGKISKEEFMASCKGTNCSQRFDALDTNKDGYLTKEELQEKAASTKEKAKEQIDAMDTNKDGKISKEEFMASCKGTNCSQRFDALDTNKDGYLTKEELQEKAASTKGRMRNRGQQPAN
jgi:hypothetical protein